MWELDEVYSVLNKESYNLRKATSPWSFIKHLEIQEDIYIKYTIV